MKAGSSGAALHLPRTKPSNCTSRLQTASSARCSCATARAAPAHADSVRLCDTTDLVAMRAAEPDAVPAGRGPAPRARVGPEAPPEHVATRGVVGRLLR